MFWDVGHTAHIRIASMTAQVLLKSFSNDVAERTSTSGLRRGADHALVSNSISSQNRPCGIVR